jgi:hypothetical protein
MKCFHLICQRFSMAAFAAGLLITSLADADNDVWKTAANGTWSAGGSWVDGSPPDSIFDSATFDKSGAYTVSFSADPDVIGKLVLTNAANVTFASSTRPGNPIVPRTLRFTFADESLLLANGTSLTLGATSGGFPATSTPFHITAQGDLRVDHATTLNVKFGSVVDVSGSSKLNGNITVSAGSLVQQGGGFIGSDATINIVGASSRLTNTAC